MESLIRHGFIRIPLGGLTFTIGKNGIVDWENECPEHLTTPERVGKTSVTSSSSFTLVWIVWFSFTFLSNVFSGLDFSYLYSKSSSVFLLIFWLCLIEKNWRVWKKKEFDFSGLKVILNLVGTLGFNVALSGNIWKTVMNSPFKFSRFWFTQYMLSLHCNLFVTIIYFCPLRVMTSQKPNSMQSSESSIS